MNTHSELSALMSQCSGHPVGTRYTGHCHARVTEYKPAIKALDIDYFQVVIA